MYDPDGKRLKKHDSAGITKSVWDNANTLLETDNNNDILAVYTLEPVYYGNLLSQFRSGASSYYHFDGLGSTDRITNSAGLISDDYIYRAFGELATSHTTTVNSFRYIGRSGYYYDSDIDLSYLRARYYDPIRNRFLTKDDMSLFRPFITTSLVARPVHEHSTLYIYVGNNPVVYTDPSGQISRHLLCSITIKLCAYGALFAGVVTADLIISILLADPAFMIAVAGLITSGPGGTLILLAGTLVLVVSLVAVFSIGCCPGYQLCMRMRCPPQPIGGGCELYF